MIVRPLQSPAVKRHFNFPPSCDISRRENIVWKNTWNTFKAFCPRPCQDISECHDLQVGGRRAQRELEGGRNHFRHWKNMELVCVHGTSFFPLGQPKQDNNSWGVDTSLLLLGVTSWIMHPSNSPCSAPWQVWPGHVILSDNQLLILHKYYQIADSEAHEASQTFSHSGSMFNRLGVQN